MQAMVWKVCEIESNSGTIYWVWDKKKNNFYYFPIYCLAPAFDDEKDTDLNLSWKEVTVVIDGKEYTAVMK